MPTAAPVEPRERALEAARKMTSIATLPEITAKIIRTVEDPKSTAKQLHQLISYDPSLVTRIVKLVNSSFYSLPGQISSIERAIVLLGLTAVKNLAVAASIGQMFRGAKLCDGFTAKDLWTHCVAVAVAAREMAKQMKLPLADEAFLGGMIHDIGLLVSLQLWPEKLRHVCERVKRTGEDFCTVEREEIGIDHGELGAALAEQWKFPKSCQQVAAHHHGPSALGEEGRLLVGLVYVADGLVCRSGHGFNLTANRESIDAAHLLQLGIDPNVVESVTAGLGALMESARPLMG